MEGPKMEKPEEEDIDIPSRAGRLRDILDSRRNSKIDLDKDQKPRRSVSFLCLFVIPRVFIILMGVWASVLVTVDDIERPWWFSKLLDTLDIKVLQIILGTTIPLQVAIVVLICLDFIAERKLTLRTTCSAGEKESHPDNGISHITQHREHRGDFGDSDNKTNGPAPCDSPSHSGRHM